MTGQSLVACGFVAALATTVLGMGYLYGRRRPYIGKVFGYTTLASVLIGMLGTLTGIFGFLGFFVGIFCWIALLPVATLTACAVAKLRGD